MPSAFYPSASIKAIFRGALIFDGLMPNITRSEFDFIGNGDMVARGKPAPDIYLAALKQLDLRPGDAIAIEDTPESAQAAIDASLRTLAFPGLAARDRSFPSGAERIGHLSADLFEDTQAQAAE